MKLKVHFTLVVMSLVFLYTSLYKEFLIFLGIITLHELGHLLMCLIFRQKVNYIMLTVVGGILDAEIRKLPFAKEFLIYISGISINVLLILASKFISDFYLRSLIYNYNLLLIGFNLLPIYPLDGFRIIDLIISRLMDPFRVFKLVSWISWLALLGLLVFSIFIKSWAFVILVFYLSYQNLVFSTMKSQFVLKKIVRQYKN